MIEVKYKISYVNGLHARPATMLVAKANTFKSNMIIEYNNRKVNLKSIMGVLSLGIVQNQTFKIVFSGLDEEAAKERITAIINDINRL